ncbi:phage holin family protein [Halodesulfovibrio sp.]|uniref:phage holin family protein n=1 Tax=Halodesulfovibrio sp. TaxID=1912772 RepID=UPI0025E97CDD|nr:phage holin family protein [Halodesulfovibrio sp.]MCT4627786.1 phage holin family protein [Halodesulfovibrio sp.]
MNDSMNRFQLLIRSEMALLRIQAKRIAAQAACKIVALLFALLALGMLTFAGYQALAVPFGYANAALIVALVDGFLALLFVLISNRSSRNTEQEKMLKEIREMVYGEFNSDVNEIKTEINRVTTDIKRTHDSIATVISSSGELIGSITPILSFLAFVVKKHKEKKQS